MPSCPFLLVPVDFPISAGTKNILETLTFLAAAAARWRLGTCGFLLLLPPSTLLTSFVA
jgi:hypothetical protein